MKGECPGCGSVDVELVNHHWYDDTSHKARHNIFICRSCNSRLSTPSDELNHILPDWDAQRDILNNVEPISVIESTINQLLPRFFELTQEKEYWKTRVLNLQARVQEIQDTRLKRWRTYLKEKGVI